MLCLQYHIGLRMHDDGISINYKMTRLYLRGADYCLSRRIYAYLIEYAYTGAPLTWDKPRTCSYAKNFRIPNTYVYYCDSYLLTVTLNSQYALFYTSQCRIGNAVTVHGPCN